jgi:hypothetical protein
MADIDTNLVVVDVVTMWSIDAALFLLAGLGFLAWSTVARGAGQSVAAFAIELAVCLVVERWATTLHRADRLKGASPLPAGARRGSVLGYTLKSVAVVGVSGAVAAGAATALSSPNLIGGWFAAYGSSGSSPPCVRAGWSDAIASSTASAWARRAIAAPTSTTSGRRRSEGRVQHEDDPRVGGGLRPVAAQAGGEALVHRTAPDRAADVDPHDRRWAAGAQDPRRRPRPGVEDGKAEALAP